MFFCWFQLQTPELIHAAFVVATNQLTAAQVGAACNNVAGGATSQEWAAALDLVAQREFFSSLLIAYFSRISTKSQSLRVLFTLTTLLSPFLPTKQLCFTAEYVLILVFFQEREVDASCYFQLIQIHTKKSFVHFFVANHCFP